MMCVRFPFLPRIFVAQFYAPSCWYSLPTFNLIYYILITIDLEELLWICHNDSESRWHCVVIFDNFVKSVFSTAGWRNRLTA